MVTISFHQVCIATLSLGLTCGISSCSTKHWYGYKGGGLFDLGDDEKSTAIKALTIIGVGFLGFALILEILMMVSSSFKNNRAINILCLICCAVAGVSLVSSVSVFGANYATGSYSVWLLTACTVFALEAFLFYLVQWRFS